MTKVVIVWCSILIFTIRFKKNMFDAFESLEDVIEKEGLDALSAIENVQRVMDLLSRIDEMTREEGVIEGQLREIDPELVSRLQSVNNLVCDSSGVLHDITDQLDPSNYDR